MQNFEDGDQTFPNANDKERCAWVLLVLLYDKLRPFDIFLQVIFFLDIFSREEPAKANACGLVDSCRGIQKVLADVYNDILNRLVAYF